MQHVPAQRDERDPEVRGARQYWPAAEWRTSAPEVQGMSSDVLSRMIERLRDPRMDLHSLLIVRHGYLVLELYFPPYGPDIRHTLASGTKSVISALIGCAIQDGHLKSVDEKLLEDIFPDKYVAKDVDKKREIRLKHLLEMTSGFKWDETGISYASSSNPAIRMHKSRDWVRFVLDRPMGARPGSTFSYNSGASHLLSAAIQARTRLPASRYAVERLFSPLGILNVYWPGDINGISLGGSGLQLTPRDMTRFGYLYLRDGVWAGKPLLPPEWVEESTRRRHRAAGAASTRSWLWQAITRILRIEPPAIPKMDYSYHWWIPAAGGYAARGWGGQAIFVRPDLDLVAVFTGGLPRDQNFLPEDVMGEYIVPAVRSNQAIAVDRQRVRRLTSLVDAASRPEPLSKVDRPATAAAISGKTYRFGPRVGGMESLSLAFDGHDEVRLTVVQKGETYDVPVGLDQNFRVSSVSESESLALRGAWSAANVFVLDWRALHAGTRATLALTFDNDRVKLRSSGSDRGRGGQIVGRQQ